MLRHPIKVRPKGMELLLVFLKTTDIHTCMHTDHKRGCMPALAQLSSKPYITVFVQEGTEAQRAVE